MFLPVTPQPSVHVYTAPRGAWSAPRGRSKVVEARDMLRPDRVGFAVTSRRALCIILLAAVGLRSCVQVPRIPRITAPVGAKWYKSLVPKENKQLCIIVPQRSLTVKIRRKPRSFCRDIILSTKNWNTEMATRMLYDPLGGTQSLIPPPNQYMPNPGSVGLTYNALFQVTHTTRGTRSRNTAYIEDPLF
jgi:hypothetical protein